MIKSFNGNIINTVDDWFVHSPPTKGDMHWRDGKSAKELAKSWCRSGNAKIPSEILKILDSNSNTKGFIIDYGIPEMKTKLDGYKGNGRNHDLILLGESVGIRTLVAIV